MNSRGCWYINPKVFLCPKYTSQTYKKAEKKIQESNREMHEKENNQEKSKKKKILISISDFDFRTHKGPKATSFYIEI